MHTLSVPTTTSLASVFRGADLDAQVTYFLKKGTPLVHRTGGLQIPAFQTRVLTRALVTFWFWSPRARMHSCLILDLGSCSGFCDVLGVGPVAASVMILCGTLCFSLSWPLCLLCGMLRCCVLAAVVRAGLVPYAQPRRTL